MLPLIQGLLKPEAYDHPVSAIQLLETHISWVILTGEYAYKLKKPVNLGFLCLRNGPATGYTPLNHRTADSR